MFTLGHLSDWHATSPNGAGTRAFLNKRFFGWLSWNLRRSKLYFPEVLDALVEDRAIGKRLPAIGSQAEQRQELWVLPV